MQMHVDISGTCVLTLIEINHICLSFCSYQQCLPNKCLDESVDFLAKHIPTVIHSIRRVATDKSIPGNTIMRPKQENKRNVFPVISYWS